jgi:tetratricopeptide (TPR) repeat protein
VRKKAFRGLLLNRLTAVLLPCLALILAVEAGVRLYFLAKSPRTPEAVFEIFVLGESSAAGWPYGRAVAFPNIAALLFDGQVNGRPVAVNNLAAPGALLHSQYLAFERAVRHRRRDRPGAVFVYAGHNDHRVSSEKSLGATLVRGLFARSMAFRHFLSARGRPLTEDARAFDLNLREVLDLAARSGLTAVVATAASDRRDVEPGVPVFRLARPEEREECLAFFAAGEALERAGRLDEAVRHYDGAAAGRPAWRGQLYFRRAECRRRLGDAAARDDYARAADEEAAGFRRATRAQNDVVRRLAAEFSAALVDAEAEFAARAPGGVPGHELFVDGHHPNEAGQVLLGGLFARALAGRLRLPPPAAAPPAETVFASLGYGRNDRLRQALATGGWFLAMAVETVLPARRLGSADRWYRRASEVSAESPQAWLGRALVSAADGWISDGGETDWLKARGFLNGTAGERPADDWRELYAKLRRWGAAEELVRNAERFNPPSAWRGPPERTSAPARPAPSSAS